MSKSATRDKWGQTSSDLTTAQRSALEALFAEDSNPAKSVRLSLSLQIGISPQHIGRWFSMRRSIMSEPDMHAHIRKKDHTQLQILVDSFSNSPFPEMEEKRNLVAKTGLSLKQVTSWFQNYRHKMGMTSVHHLTEGLVNRRFCESVVPSQVRTTDYERMRVKLMKKQVWTEQMELAWQHQQQLVRMQQDQLQFAMGNLGNLSANSFQAPFSTDANGMPNLPQIPPLPTMSMTMSMPLSLSLPNVPSLPPLPQLPASEIPATSVSNKMLWFDSAPFPNISPNDPNSFVSNLNSYGPIRTNTKDN